MTSTRSKSRGNAAAGGTATLHMRQPLQPNGIDALGGVFRTLDGDGGGGASSAAPLYRRSMPSSVGLGGGGGSDGGGVGRACPYVGNYNTLRAAAAASSRGLGVGYCRGSVGTTTSSNPGSWGSDMGVYPSPAGSLYGRRGISSNNVGGASDHGGATVANGTSTSAAAAASSFDRYDSATSPSPYRYGTDTRRSSVWPSTGVSTSSSGSSATGTCSSNGRGNSHNFDSSVSLNMEQQRGADGMASSTSLPRRASDVPDGGAREPTDQPSLLARWFGSGSTSSPPQQEPPSEEPGANVHEPGPPHVPSVRAEFSSPAGDPLAAAAPPPEGTAASPPPPPSPPVTRRTSARRKRKREPAPAEENRDANATKSRGGRAAPAKRAVQVKAEGVDDDPPSPDSSGVACCICLDVATKAELAKVNGCAHSFCFACIEKWAERENTCPLCKVRFTKIDRVNRPPSRKRKKGDAPSPRAKNTKRVKNRDQRADFTGSNALQGLLANMESGSLPHSIAQFIFSNVTGGLMTLNSGTSGGGPQGSNRLPSGAISGSMVARAFPLQIGPNGPYSTRSSSRGMPPRAFHFEINRAPSDGGGGAADDPFDPIMVQPGSTTFVSGASPTSSTLRRSLQRSIPPQQDTAWEQHLAASGGSSSDIDIEYDDDDDEADEFGGSGGDNYGSFIQRVRDLSNHRNSVLHRYQVGIGGGVGGGGGGGGVGGPPRSYAVNSQDLTAGESAENALEIEDSDEDDDLDVVEVVDVGAN